MQGSMVISGIPLSYLETNDNEFCSQLILQQQRHGKRCPPASEQGNQDGQMKTGQTTFQ